MIYGTIMGKLLSPDEILFLHPERKSQYLADSTIPFCGNKVDKNVIIMKKFSEAQLSFFQNDFKLQVMENKGRFFALNSAHLSILRHLQAVGTCRLVDVSVISTTLIPEALLRMLDTAPAASISTTGEKAEQCSPSSTKKWSGSATDGIAGKSADYTTGRSTSLCTLVNVLSGKI